MGNELSFKLLAAILAAGATGTALRFFAMRFITVNLGDSFPVATLLVNVAGAFAAGMIYTFLRQHTEAFAPLAPIVLIGFLGAFTTFSTFALECANMLAAGAYGQAAANFLLQNLLGIAAALAGIFTAKCF